MTINNKIQQRGPYTAIELPAQTGTILPGMLIEHTASDTLQAHSTAGGFAEDCFALEDALQGKTTLDLYAVGDPVQAAICQRGNIVMALLKAGNNYPIGTKLISAGDGTLKPTTGTPSKIIGSIIITAVNLTASAAVNTLAQIRVW